ncbi:hypothetical protein [Methylobacterium sp. WL6]|uniref:hypothetical protein n=1 Tax=Methylobacterium sp. WL6 TaxID=2603901 RepID=UPI0011CC0326|nr:hypothetical protein [Methylobacterium sp. WL6]TXN73267.1 hypothetical protein FV230_02000 [Methylobacterium sp. WL6]
MMDKLDLIRRLVAAIVAAFARIFGFAIGPVGEALVPLTRRTPAIRDAVALGASGAAMAAGTVLEGPGRILDATAGAAAGVLGALVPRRAPTAEDVAGAALANDNGVPDTAYRGGPMMTYGDTVVAHAKARAGLASGRGLGQINRETADWLNGMSPAQMALVALADPHDVHRHLRARRRLELIEGLPEPMHMQHELARERARVEAERSEREAERLFDEHMRDPATIARMQQASAAMMLH